jgi:hypothetical protein
MSWLRALELGLNITNVAVNLENAEKLSQLQKLGEAAEQRQINAEIRAQNAEQRKLLINRLRSEFFTYRQAADAALESEAQSAFRTAVALKLLDHRLNETNISPADFEEFADKEFVHTVYKLLRDNANRIISTLSNDEQVRAHGVVHALIKLPEYDYFIAHFDDYRKLQEAEQVIASLEKKNVPELAQGLLWAKVILALVLLFQSLSYGSPAIFVLSIGLWVGLYIAQARWQREDEYLKAVKIQKTLLPLLNKQLMSSVMAEVGSTENAAKLRAEAKSIITQEFGADNKVLVG